MRTIAPPVSLPSLRALGLGALAGALAGILVGGIGGRIVMRISGAMSDPALVGIAVTDNGNVLGEITAGGTFALVVFAGILPGLLGGVLYVAARPWLRALGRWDGLAFGLVLLAVFGATVIEPFNIDFRKFGSPPVNVVMFALLFPLFGIAQAALTRLLEPRATHTPAWEGAAFLGSGLALLLLGLSVAATIMSIVDGDTSDPQALIAAYWFVAAVGLRWALSHSRPLTDVRELSARARIASTTVLLLPAILTLPATIRAIASLLRA